MTLLRYERYDRSWDIAQVQAAENARDTNRALRERVTGQLVYVRRYVALGSPGAKIKLPPMQPPPAAVVLVRVVDANLPGSPVAVTPSLTFVTTREALEIFEPDGLWANVPYDLTFLVLEG